MEHIDSLFGLSPCQQHMIVLMMVSFAHYFETEYVKIIIVLCMAGKYFSVCVSDNLLCHQMLYVEMYCHYFVPIDDKRLQGIIIEK